MSADVLTPVGLEVLRDLDMLPRAFVQVPRWKLPEAVRFVRDEDDLDAFEVAVLCAESETSGFTVYFATHFEASRSPDVEHITFLLLRYHREPEDQLTVFLPGSIADQEDIGSAVRRVASALNLLPEAFVQLVPTESATHVGRIRSERT